MSFETFEQRQERVVREDLEHAQQTALLHQKTQTEQEQAAEEERLADDARKEAALNELRVLPAFKVIQDEAFSPILNQTFFAIFQLLKPTITYPVPEKKKFFGSDKWAWPAWQTSPLDFQFFIEETSNWPINLSGNLEIGINAYLITNIYFDRDGKRLEKYHQILITIRLTKLGVATYCLSGKEWVTGSDCDYWASSMIQYDNFQAILDELARSAKRGLLQKNHVI